MQYYKRINNSSKMDFFGQHLSDYAALIGPTQTLNKQDAVKICLLKALRTWAYLKLAAAKSQFTKPKKVSTYLARRLR
jgi:hypothetical protein